jgi:hypothetical protein
MKLRDQIAREPMTLPTESEINPIPDDLDGQVAVKHFLGKTVQDAVDLFGENSLVYQEDLMWMGPKAFCYYLPAVLEHFRQEADPDLVAFIASVLEFRLEHDAKDIRQSFATIAAICAHLLEADIGATERGRLHGIGQRMNAALSNPE